MEDLDKILEESIETYFSSLANSGYLSYDNVYKLLLLSIAEELLDGKMSFYMTEKDYSDISKALYCVFGTTCLVPYPTYKDMSSSWEGNDGNYFRITEDEILRSSESGRLRTVSL